MPPKGLANMGNTCYFNTTVQCLVHCRRFMAWLATADLPTNKAPMLYALRTLMAGQELTGPGELVHKTQEAMRSLMTIREPNDMGEFVVLWMDKLHDEIARPLAPKAVGALTPVHSPYDILRHRVQEAWYAAHRKDYSELKELACGQLVSQIVCGHCKHIHHNYEVFMNTMVSIEGAGEGNTMEACLAHHFKDHILTEWVCDQCRQTTPSVQSSKITRAPSIMVITLKRFNAQLQKIPTHVAVPLALDIASLVIGCPALAPYQLRSVGFHVGGYHGGHYFAVCHSQDNWWLIDDDVVRPTDAQGVGHGYVFFYERDDPPAMLAPSPPSS